MQVGRLGADIFGTGDVERVVRIARRSGTLSGRGFEEFLLGSRIGPGPGWVEPIRIRPVSAGPFLIKFVCPVAFPIDFERAHEVVDIEAEGLVVNPGADQVILRLQNRLHGLNDLQPLGSTAATTTTATSRGSTRCWRGTSGGRRLLGSNIELRRRGSNLLPDRFEVATVQIKLPPRGPAIELDLILGAQ